MKTFADFKRNLTVGSKWATFNHVYQKDLGIGEVVKKQTNAVCFKRVVDGEEKNSWFHFPGASEIEIVDGSINVYTKENLSPYCPSPRKLILTYTLKGE